MSVVVQDRLEAISREAWNGLVSQAVTSTSFQTYEWHRAWLDTFGVAEGLRLVCVYNGERLRAVAPLRLERKIDGGVLKFIGDDRADYADIIYASEDTACLEAIFRYLSREVQEADEIELNNIPAEAPTVKYFEKRRPGSGWYPVWRATVPCPTMILAGQDEFVQGVLAKKSLRRSVKHYEVQGVLELCHAREPKEIHAGLKAFFDQHIQRWGLRGPQSLFILPENRAFYRRLVDEMGPTGRLLFSSLRCAGKLIACHLGFQDDKRLIWYKPTFDLAEADHYPGGVFLKKVIEWGLREGLRELDFTRGNEFYKTRFANRVRYNRNLTLARSGKQAMVLSLKETVRRSPVLLRAVRSGLELKTALCRPSPRNGGGRCGGAVVVDVNDQYGRINSESAAIMGATALSGEPHGSRLLAKHYGWEQGLSRPEAEILNRFRPELPQMKMLNVGIGIGRTGLYFAPLVQTYSALAWSAKVVRAAQDFVGDHIDPHVFIQGDIRRMPYPSDAGFDFILFSDQALAGIAAADRKLVLGEIRRVAQKGAWFCLSAYNLQSLTLRGGRNSPAFWRRWTRYRLLAAANGDLAALRLREEAMINDPDSHCPTPVLYINPRLQVQQLDKAGFSDMRIFSLDTGAEVLPYAWDSLTDVWLYYLCRV